MILIHHMTENQVENLREIFSKPMHTEGASELVWIAPEWMLVAYQYVNRGKENVVDPASLYGMFQVQVSW